MYPAGTLVRSFETFDAVAAGVADMYHSAEYYWEKKSPAFNFFAAVPFGFTANERSRGSSTEVVKTCGTR
jgi:TRAP-type mannitol/chloroaromatic compound transport system substrate-binding protein